MSRSVEQRDAVRWSTQHTRVERLEAAIRKCLDHGASGYADWNAEGESYIITGGFTLLKQVLEEK